MAKLKECYLRRRIGGGMEIIMKKEFKIGIQLENDTEYYATEKEYHIYAEDTVQLCDDRYVALRAHDTKEFDAFVVIKDKKNITIDFGGATLVMHGKIQPFLVDSSENITIKNCSVTYNRPPFTEAPILESTPEYVRLRLNERCTCYMEDGRLVPFGDGWENHRLNYKGSFYQVFDRETRNGCGIGLGVMGNHIELEPGWPYTPVPFVAEEDGEDVILRGNIPEYYREGKILIITHETRSLSSIFMIDSKNVAVEKFRVLLGWGMGIYSYRTENITLDRVIMTYDDASPCLIANAADAVHTFGTSGNFEIKNCVLEGMIDDGINIHANFRTVASASGRDIYTHLASCEKQADDLYRVGDEIAVYKGKTMEEVARYVIESIEDAGDKVKKFTVDRPVAEHSDGDLIESLTANCDVLIENCIFGKANSHLRLQTRGKFVMRNCETELPLLLSGDASFWFESGPLTDFTVEGCRFVGGRAFVALRSEIMPSEAAPYYHRNLKIIGNTFDVGVPLDGGYADGIVFKGNKNSSGAPMTLQLTNCGSVDAEDCTVLRRTEKKESLGMN